jgi:aminopeptidase N
MLQQQEFLMSKPAPDKTRLYLAIGLGVAVLVLLVVALMAYFSGGDVTAPVGAAGVAAAAAAETARRQRNESRAAVEEAKVDSKVTGAEITANHDTAVAEMGAVEEEVAAKTDEDLKSEGEDAFGPGRSV